MLFRAVLSILTLLGSIAPLYNAKLISRQKSLVCASGAHVIAASGDGEDNIGGYGLLGSLVSSVTAAIPGSDNVTLPYPKDEGDGRYRATTGGTLEIEYITDYVASCPETKIILLGYSLGGAITLNALCGASPPLTFPIGALNPALASHIVGAVVYGEQARSVLSPFNAGTCKENGLRTRTGESATCPASASKIRSYCDNGDAQCCSGFYLDIHRSYPAKYDKLATEFLTSLYKQSPPLVTSSTSAIQSSTSQQSMSSTTASQSISTPATSMSASSASPTAISSASASASSPPVAPTNSGATGSSESPTPSPASNSGSPNSLPIWTYLSNLSIGCWGLLLLIISVIT